MPKNQKSSILKIIDVSVLLLALWYVFSVIKNAQILIQDDIKDAPASLALIVGLLLLALSSYKSKSLSTLNIISLTVWGTAIVIWLLGLSTILNFN